MPSPRILIVGGSTRAAADSVRRAGGVPICADLFVDLDLRMSAEVVPVQKYPESLAVDLAGLRADAWFYCGALENHPRTLDAILATNASLGPLIGTTPAGCLTIRNPLWLAQTLRSAGIPALSVRDQSMPPVSNGTWLQKPLAGAGGRSIRVWGDMAAQISMDEPHYFQQAVSGKAMSAIFRFHPRGIEFVGISSEIESGEMSQSPSRFTYCGSIGPWVGQPSLERSIRAQLQRIADVLAANVIGLRGLVGFDFRLSSDQVWLTEVNPRYTASVEVLELATQRSLLKSLIAEELKLCPGSESDCVERECQDGSNEGNVRQCVAKQILYAATRLVVPDLSPLLSTENIWQCPIVADVPIAGTIVDPGWPVCTVLACGDSIEHVEVNLRNRVELIRAKLEETDRIRKPNDSQ